MAQYYYPWMTATLEVPIYGTREERNRMSRATETRILPLRPFRAELELNDHNQADGLELSVDWFDAGVDPRLIDDGVVRFYAGDARGYASEYDIQDRLSCRFVGLLREINTARTSDSAQVHLSCIDYTRLFLEAKPFGSLGVPSYDMTLEDAWHTIVSQTPGAEVLANRIRFEDVDAGTQLGAAVSARFAKLAQVPTHPKTDAWAVWQQCVGMLGLVSFIRLDECIVTPFTNLYTESDAPVFIWGKNLSEWHESRIAAQSRKGIMLVSFDPETGRTLEAFYPPQAEKEKNKVKRMPASTIDGSKPAPVKDEDREVLQFPAVTNPEQLQKLAQQIWEERSRQELEGSITSVVMTTETERRNEFDLLGIHAGESIRVQADPEEQSHLNSLPQGERIDYLVGRGYTREVAQTLVDGMSDLHRLESKFYVKSGRITMESTSEGGGFEVELEYVNRIQLTGDTAPSA